MDLDFVTRARNDAIAKARDPLTTIQTQFGPLRIITPTQSVMDRLSAYVSWNDNQAFAQAAMVAARHDIDWGALRDWARREQGDDKVVQRLRRKSIRY